MTRAMVLVAVMAAIAGCGGEPNERPEEFQPSVDSAAPPCSDAQSVTLIPPTGETQFFSCTWTCVSFQGRDYERVQLTWERAPTGWDYFAFSGSPGHCD